MTQSEWRKHVEKWGRSGESCGAFAKRHGLCPRRLGWWRWKLGQDGSHFVEVAVSGAENPPLTLHINNHVVSFDVDQLSAVLDILESR